MKVISLQKGTLFLPLGFPNEINKEGNTLKYFVRGEGYKKTKSFKVLEGVELPDRWAKLSWLDVCKIYDQYGLEVANVYSECKVAGIISKQTIIGKYQMYKIIKDILPVNFDSDFFDILRCDYLPSCFGLFMFDITGVDKAFSEADKEYDCENCTYQGRENVSMKQYVELKYGSEYVKIIEALIPMAVDRNGNEITKKKAE